MWNSVTFCNGRKFSKNYHHQVSQLWDKVLCSRTHCWVCLPLHWSLTTCFMPPPALFCMVAVTNHYKLDGLKLYKFISRCSGGQKSEFSLAGPKSKCWQD